MNKKENLIAELLKLNNGTLKASDAKLAGISYKALQRMTEAGLLERISHGLYISPLDIPDDYLIAQHKCGKGIYSHETALFLHGLSDRTPLQLMMTIPSGFNCTLIKDKALYRFYYSKPSVYPLGVTEILSPHGNKLRVYDKGRTICDCIKKKDQLDSDLVLSAIKQYMRKDESDFAKLLAYAEKLGIRDTVRQYMEVLV